MIYEKIITQEDMDSYENERWCVCVSGWCFFIKEKYGLKIGDLVKFHCVPDDVLIIKVMGLEINGHMAYEDLKTGK